MEFSRPEYRSGLPFPSPGDLPNPRIKPGSPALQADSSPSEPLEFLKKLKIEIPYDPALPLLGIYPEKTLIQKDTCTPMFIAALFIIIKTWKQTKCLLTGEWIKKMWYMYTMEYHSTIKKNEIMPFAATWMDLDIIIASEVKSGRERQISYDIGYMWNLKT